MRLLRAAYAKYRWITIGSIALPALAALVFVLYSASPTFIPATQTYEIIASIRTAQAEELARAESSIYHVVRRISEGKDKQAYVAEVMGVSDVAEHRVDTIETYQHADTSLALVTSNGTTRPFEAFLSRETGTGGLALYHYGPESQKVESVRSTYDQAHDLASLYSAYTSLERASVPVLPNEATFIGFDEGTRHALFKTQLSDTIRIVSYVDLATKLVVEEVIYVRGRTTEYEMTRITYVERDALPSTQFDEIFDAERFRYTIVAIAEAA